MSSIIIKDLSKTFLGTDQKVEALKKVNIEIKTGDIYGFIGMSGAGKSTLVRCINFLEKPTEGEVIIDGESLGDLSEKDLRQKRQRIGMIFQHFNLLMQKSVLDNVCFPLMIQGRPKVDSKKRALELLEIVGLSDKANAYPSQLSGGQKQRVAIARALASEIDILLCDEATSALDPATTASILKLLKEINVKFGITIVIITHSMAVVREVCKNVAILSNGEVVESGDVSEIFTHPKTKVAKDLVERDNATDVEQKREYPNEIQNGNILRIVFSENSAFEPVISKAILKFQEPINILRADTKNVSGVAKGEMILELSNETSNKEGIVAFLKDSGLYVEEVENDIY